MEYLIKRTDGDWFSLKKLSYGEVLRPQTIPSHQIEGWGDHRIKIPNGIIAFSYEDPGIQVIFENYSGTSDEALGMVKEILQNIENMTHEKGEIMEL